MRYDTVILDLDGTITESAPGIMRSAAYALEKMGRPVPGEDVLRRFVGPPLVDSFIRYCGLTEAEAMEAIEIYRERHTVLGWKEARVYTGIAPMLIALKRAGAYIALASSKPLPLCEKTLDYFGLLPLFDRLSAPPYSATKADKKQLILDALPARFERACMIGDRRFDMDGARRSGVTAIGAGYGYGSEEELLDSGAQVYCPDVASLADHLLEGIPRMPGFFLSLEGSDGCGKSTQAALLRQFLEDAGYPVTYSREPGGCPISERIRDIILDVRSEGMSDECEALLYAASRAQHVHEVILPALRRGDVMLCDRFVDSSIAYQGVGRGLGYWVWEINRRAAENNMPNLTLFFDLNPDEAIRRRLNAAAADRLESEGDRFMRVVYDAFIGICEKHPDRIVRVDASGNIEQIRDRVRQIVVNRLTAVAKAV